MARNNGLGQVLAGYRRRAGLTQREVASRAAVSVAGLRDIEQGRVATPKASTLRRLAVALGVPAAEVTGLAQPADLAGPAGPHRPVTRPASQVWIGVLGPLAVRVDGVDVDPGSEVQRMLLATLALSPNVPVNRELLLERATTGGRPSMTVGGLAARISRLRRRLRPAAQPAAGGPSLVADAGGYVLLVDEEQLDLLAFRSLVERARQRQAAADLPQAYELYARAARGWRGEPLAELTGLANDPVVVGLVRQWRSVVTEYASVAAALGRYGEVVPLLRRLIAADPLDEVAHARLMVALAGSGRQAEALVLFDTLRRRLDREIGAAPGPELLAAHRRVLRQEVTAPPPAPTRARRTLPADIAEFTGRAAELRQLHAAAPRWVAIEGMAGVGKTRLAVRFAHQLVAAGRYPNLHLTADLRGYAERPPADPATVLESFLHLLGVPADRIPVDLAGRAARYRELLRGRAAIVLLDDAASARQLAPLLPGDPTPLVIVTSRRALGLAGAHRLQLDVFPQPEALALLAAIAGPDRVAADRDAARQVVDGCGRLPLAVALVARRLAARPALSLAGMAARLAGPGHRIGELAAGGRSVRAALDRSYRVLPTDVRRHLRAMGAHPAGELSAGSVAALAGTTLTGAQRALRRLLHEHLATIHHGDRYRLHDLVHAYASEIDDGRPE